MKLKCLKGMVHLVVANNIHSVIGGNNDVFVQLLKPYIHNREERERER